MIAIALSASHVPTANLPRFSDTVFIFPLLSVPLFKCIVALRVFGVNVVAILHTPLTFRNFVFHVDVQILSYPRAFVAITEAVKSTVIPAIMLCCVIMNMFMHPASTVPDRAHPWAPPPLVIR